MKWFALLLSHAAPNVNYVPIPASGFIVYSERFAKAYDIHRLAEARPFGHFTGALSPLEKLREMASDLTSKKYEPFTTDLEPRGFDLPAGHRLPVGQILRVRPAAACCRGGGSGRARRARRAAGDGEKNHPHQGGRVVARHGFRRPTGQRALIEATLKLLAKEGTDYTIFGDG